MKRKRFTGVLSFAWMSCLSPLLRLVSWDVAGQTFDDDNASALSFCATSSPPLLGLAAAEPPLDEEEPLEQPTKEPPHKRRKTDPNVCDDGETSDDGEKEKEKDIEEGTLACTDAQPQASPSPSLIQDPHLAALCIPAVYHELHTNESDPYGWLFIRELPTRPACPSGFALPEIKDGSHPLTLVLDLDETLVHCSVEPLPKPDFIFPVTLDGVMHKVYGKKRPHLEVFLKAACQLFEVVLFTASQKVYAKKVLKRIDPNHTITHRRYREACTFVEGSYVKDLTTLGRPLRRCVLVDNSPQAFGYQLDNGVLIKSWEGDEADAELPKILSLLHPLLSMDDVRPYLREKLAYYKHVY